MLRKLRERMYNEEKGFTLIELLVVILIIGILAAIALPAFLGQRAKAQDSDAKSNVRNMVSQVESCYTTTQDYANCTTGGATQLDTGGINATVATSAGGYTVTSVSGSGNTFQWVKNGNTITRPCTNAGTDKGGCKSTNTW
jgi:type IV pilus assembly protein PilA